MDLIEAPRKPWLYRYFGLPLVPVALLAGVAAFGGVLLALSDDTSPAYGLGILTFGPVAVLGSGAVVGLAFAVTMTRAGNRGTRAWLGLCAALAVSGVTEVLLFALSIALIRGFDSDFGLIGLWA